MVTASSRPPLAHRTRRLVVRGTGVLLGGLLLVLAVAGPALAAQEEGADNGPGLGTGLTLLIFLGIPLAVAGVLALLIYGPSMLRRPRYRPGRTEWDYQPVWIGGPDDPKAALTRTPADVVIDVRGGGASAGW